MGDIGVMASMFDAVGEILSQQMNVFGFIFTVSSILIFEWVGNLVVDTIVNLMD